MADSSQDVRDASLSRVDGVNTLRFTKEISSGDDGQDVALDGEVFVVHPVSGGSVFGGRSVGKHDQTPIVAPEPMVIRQCQWRSTGCTHKKDYVCG